MKEQEHDRVGHKRIVIPLIEKTAGILTYINPFHYLPMTWRRNLYVVGSQLLLPSTVIDINQSFKKVEELVKDGYGLVIATRHLSNRDFLMETGLTRKKSGVTRTEDGERAIFVPFAYHQQGLGVKGFLEYWGVIPKTIVTAETVSRGKNFDYSGQELPLGHGFRSYLGTASQALDRGEIVFMAPSATRTAVHEPWKGRPIESLVKLTKSDKVAFVSVGLDIPKVEEVEDYANCRGFNLFRNRIFLVTMGPVRTKLELQKIAAGGGIIDRVIADDIAMLVRPQSLGEAYRELREKRLA